MTARNHTQPIRLTLAISDNRVTVESIITHAMPRPNLHCVDPSLSMIHCTNSDCVPYCEHRPHMVGGL